MNRDPRESKWAKIRKLIAERAAVLGPRPLTFRKLRAERAALLVVAAEPVPHLGNWHGEREQQAMPTICYQCGLRMVEGSGYLHADIGVCGECRDHGAPRPLARDLSRDRPMDDVDHGPRAA